MTFRSWRRTKGQCPARLKLSLLDEVPGFGGVLIIAKYYLRIFVTIRVMVERRTLLDLVRNDLDVDSRICRVRRLQQGVVTDEVVSGCSLRTPIYNYGIHQMCKDSAICMIRQCSNVSAVFTQASFPRHSTQDHMLVHAAWLVLEW